MAACNPQSLSPLEQYMLADDRPGYPRTFVIGFDFSGEIDRSLFERVLAESLRNEPRLTAAVGRCGLFGVEWRKRGVSAVDLRWVRDRDELDRAACLRLDLRRGEGLRIIGVQTAGRSQLFHVFHHACCDGRGALAWLGRLYAAYSRAQRPDVPVSASDVDVDALENVALTEDLPERMGSRPQARKATWQRIRQELTTRPARLRPARFPVRTPGGPDRIPFPGSVTRALNNRQTRCLKRVAQRGCATLNDLLLCAMFRAMYEWNCAQGAAADQEWFRIMAPVDLRTPQHDSLPAANLVSCVFVTQPGSICNDPQRLLSAVSRRMQYAVRSRSALIMYNVVRRLSQVPGLLQFGLRAWRMQATALVSYVGDAGRELQADFPRQRGRCRIGDLLLNEITATGPVRPGTAANLTAGVYAGELVLNLALDPLQFSSADAEQLLDLIVSHLLESADDATISPVADRTEADACDEVPADRL